MSERLATAAIALGLTAAWAGLFYVFPALLPRFEEAFASGGPPPALGLSLALAASALAAPAAGRMVDRGLAPVMMPAAAALGALGLLGAAASQSAAAFLLSWVLIGLCCAGCLYEPAFALLARARGAGARRSIASVTLVAGFASAVAFPLAGWVESIAGWRAAMAAMAALVGGVGAPLLLVGAAALERGARGAGARRGGARVGWSRVIRRPGVARIALAFAASAMMHGLLLSHLIPVLGSRGIEGAAALALAALIGPMQVAGRLALLGAPSRTRGAVLSAAAFASMAAAALALLLAAGAPWLAFFFVALQGAAFGATAILRPTTLAETFGTEGFGALAGAVAVPYALSFAAAPILGAWLRSGWGETALIALSVALALAALALMAPLARRG